MSMDSKKILSRSEEFEIFEIIRNGTDSQKKDATDHVVLCNTSLVRKISFKQKSRSNAVLDTDDFFSYGVLGLYRAISKFDHRRGWKFSTYATYWIWRFIDLAIKDTEKLYCLYLGDIAVEVEPGLPPASLEEALPDERALSVVELVESSSVMDGVYEALSQMDEKMAEVFSLRCGFDQYVTARSWDSVAELTGRSISDVRSSFREACQFLSQRGALPEGLVVEDEG